MNMNLNKGIVSVVNVHSVCLPDEASVVWCGGSSLANQQSWKGKLRQGAHVSTRFFNGLKPWAQAKIIV